eukprot:comp20333_c0_seq1/m.25601 comp20333_c0_seq1/g.25601  ORF comp20333_c0_seq1/g.25601 comp20333_c0_seq1/m.25601 type:complete len:182 (-) comp20333_c0_seq1:234-779(-)
MSRGAVRTTPDGKKVNLELFVLTYGALVAQLLKDTGDEETVNKTLDSIGYSMGTRLAEDFLSRIAISRCTEFKETAEVLTKTLFSMYMGIQPPVTNWSEDSKEFSVLLPDNPMNDFIELPPNHTKILFSNVIAGILRGGLEAMQLKCDVWFVQDVLRGDKETEIRLRLKEVLDDEVPPSDD